MTKAFVAVVVSHYYNHIHLHRHLCIIPYSFINHCMNIVAQMKVYFNIISTLSVLNVCTFLDDEKTPTCQALIPSEGIYISDLVQRSLIPPVHLRQRLATWGLDNDHDSPSQHAHPAEPEQDQQEPASPDPSVWGS